MDIAAMIETYGPRMLEHLADQRRMLKDAQYLADNGLPPQEDVPLNPLELYGNELIELLDSVNLKKPEIDLTREETWPRL